MTIFFAQPKKPSKPLPKKEYPISIRLQSGDERVYIATGKKCLPKDLTENGASKTELNKFLQAVRTKVKEIADSGEFTPTEVKEKYEASLEVKAGPSYSDLYTKYISRKGLKPNTLKNLTKVLTDYGTFLSGKQPTNATAIAFIGSMNHSPNTMNKYAKTVKSFHKYNHFERDFDLPKTVKVNKVYLTDAEIEKLAKLELSGEDELARDTWLMMAYSGLRISDLNVLQPHNFIEDYISIKQIKTGKPATPVLSKKALALFKRYKFVKPPIHETNVNERIKTLLVKISPHAEEVTCHSGRKSFAMSLINKGLPPQVVASQLGDTIAVLLASYYSEDFNKSREEVRKLLV